MDRRLPVVRLVDIRETPLDVAEVLAALADRRSRRASTSSSAPSATTTTTRASPGWTTPRTRPRWSGCVEVARAVAEEYDVLAVAAVHRVGRLEIGDAAVVVATAAAHRGEAFEASRALIDELKATVPIWKHQVFTDGSDEWVGTP